MLTEENRAQLDGIVQKMAQNKEPDSNIRFVVDDFKKRYEIVEQTKKERDIPFVPKFAEPAVKGLAKAGEFLGMKPLGTAIAEKISGAPQTFTPKQVAGSAIQTAVLGAPIGVAKTLLGKVLQFGAVGAATGFGAGLEKGKGIGESAKEAISAGAVTGALPIVGKGISKVAARVAKPLGEVATSVLGNFIGKPPEVIKKAFENPYKVGEAMAKNKIPETIRKDGLAFLGKLKEDLSTNFKKGLAEQQRLHPFKKTGQILVKKEFGNVLDNMSRVLRDNRVGVSGSGSLNFDKLTSAITSPAERKNIQLAVNTILSQKKFLPKDVQAVSARLSKLSNFTEGVVPQSSAIIRQIHSIYKKGIEKAYPELGKIRGEYAVERKFLDEISNILGEGKWKPTTITSAVKRLSSIFNEDNETYLKVLQKLEDKTGNDILSELAASEFSKLAPKSFGSRIAQAGLLVGGTFVNPLILLALPLFSPKVVGKGTVLAGKLTGKAPEAIGKLAPIKTLLPKAAAQIEK